MPFDLQPTLVGDLVALRPLRADDEAALFEVARDPLIWAQHPDQTRYQPAGFQTFFGQSLASGGALLAIDAATQAVIGSSRYHGYDPDGGHDADGGEIEIGWTFLARSHWGGRYNREMKRLMLEHAFRFVTRVVFLVGPSNLRSQTAVERIGGVRIGTRRDGSGRESVVFAIDAADFSGL